MRRRPPPRIENIRQTTMPRAQPLIQLLLPGALDVDARAVVGDDGAGDIARNLAQRARLVEVLALEGRAGAAVGWVGRPKGFLGGYVARGTGHVDLVDEGWAEEAGVDDSASLAGVTTGLEEYVRVDVKKPPGSPFGRQIHFLRRLLRAENAPIPAAVADEAESLAHVDGLVEPDIAQVVVSGHRVTASSESTPLSRHSGQGDIPLIEKQRRLQAGQTHAPVLALAHLLGLGQEIGAFGHDIAGDDVRL